MIRVSLFGDITLRTPQEVSMPWGAFVELFRIPRQTACKGGPAWSPAIFKAGELRGANAVEEVSLLVVDLDHVSEASLQDALDALGRIQCLIHSTHSDRLTETERCVRIVIGLSRPVKASEWPRFWSAVMELLLQPLQPADSTAHDAQRIYYMPSRPCDAPDYLYEIRDGIALDVDAVLAMSPVS